MTYAKCLHEVWNLEILRVIMISATVTTGCYAFTGHIRIGKKNENNGSSDINSDFRQLKIHRIIHRHVDAGTLGRRVETWRTQDDALRNEQAHRKSILFHLFYCKQALQHLLQREHFSQSASSFPKLDSYILRPGNIINPSSVRPSLPWASRPDLVECSHTPIHTIRLCSSPQSHLHLVKMQ